MTVLSILRPFSSVATRLIPAQCSKIAVRNMGGSHKQTMVITPSRWAWHKFKDMSHFYVMIGVIPLTLITLYANIFIGPAKLAPIPEDYNPEQQEYHRNPITRFLTKWIINSYQEDYEKKLYVMHYHEEVRQMALLEKKIKMVIKEREDVQGYTFAPILTKYHKHVREVYEKTKETAGDNW